MTDKPNLDTPYFAIRRTVYKKGHRTFYSALILTILPRNVDGSLFADHGHFDLAREGHLGLDLLSYFKR